MIVPDRLSKNWLKKIPSFVCIKKLFSLCFLGNWRVDCSLPRFNQFFGTDLYCKGVESLFLLFLFIYRICEWMNYVHFLCISIAVSFLSPLCILCATGRIRLLLLFLVIVNEFHAFLFLVNFHNCNFFLAPKFILYV